MTILINVTVTVTVDPVSDGVPTANDDAVTTSEDTPLEVNVTANDADPDAGGLTVTDATDPPHGVVTNNNDGTITYTPDPNFSGTDSFVYTITDADGETATATGECVYWMGPFLNVSKDLSLSILLARCY